MKHIPKKLEIPKHLTVCRVAAYCHVSTQQEIQFHSLEAQREFFAKQIRYRKNWIFAGIYADQASGKKQSKNAGIPAADGGLPQRKDRPGSYQIDQPDGPKYATVPNGLQ